MHSDLPAPELRPWGIRKWRHAPGSLGGVHRLVSPGDEVVTGLDRVSDSDADAERGGDNAARDRYRFGARNSDLFGNRGALAQIVNSTESDQELVSPDSCHRVLRADNFPNSLGEYFEHLVASDVTPGVVDHFEFVDVDEQHRRLKPGVTWQTGDDVEPFHRRISLQGAREIVERGPTLQLGLDLNLVIFEMERGDHSVGSAVNVDVRARARADPVVLPRLTSKSVPRVHRLAFGDSRGIVLETRTVVRVDVGVEVLTDPFVGCPPENSGQRRRNPEHQSFSAAHDNVGGVFGEEAEPFF